MNELLGVNKDTAENKIVENIDNNNKTNELEKISGGPMVGDNLGG